MQRSGVPRMSRHESKRTAADGSPGIEPAEPISSRGQILQRIFDDMMGLKDAFDETPSDGVSPSRNLSTQWSGPDAESRENAWRERIRHRVDELRKKLIGARIGSYQILEEIAAGGMGIVFKARQESPLFTREIALKFLLADPDVRADDRVRFVAEVKGLAGLSHPSLVHILDSGIDGDLYYFSMELVDGWSLDSWEQARTLSLTRKVEVVRDIAHALAYLHSRGVIHRDVKPGNIMINRKGSTKLLDFGIAQFTSDPHERAIQAGTPYFMAPEVIDPHGGFGPIGPGTDIYALGAVLFQLLTGRPVFESRQGLGDVLSRTLSEAPQFPRSRSERLPADLQVILSRSLKKRVVERYQNAAQIALDLEAFLRRERHKAPVWLGAIFLAATLSVVAVLSLDSTPPATISSPERRDLGLWEERLKEIEEVDAAAATALQALLSQAQAQDDTAARNAVKNLTAGTKSFWKERVETTLTLALAAKQEFLSVRIKEDERLGKLFESPNRKLEAARSRAADRTAHGLLVEATEGFKECFVEAKKLQEDAHRDLERDEAKHARERVLTARRAILDTLETARQELAGEAKVAWESASEQITEAESLLAAQPARARGLFHEALDGFYRAGAMAKAEHAAKRARWHVEWEALQLEQDRRADRLARNLPRADLLELQQLRNSSPDFADDAGLEDFEKRLASYGQVLDRARSMVETAEHEARAAELKAQSLRPKTRVPAPLKTRLSTALQSLAEGTTQLRADHLELARNAFERAARELTDLNAEIERRKHNMVWVEGGIDVPGFWIDRCEVTVNDYAKFGRHLPTGWETQRKRGNLPVVGVSLEGAVAYARWCEKTLPTDAQWRAATNGKNGAPRRYPFGDKLDAGLVNGAGKLDGFRDLAPAASFESGASVWGALQLSGNAAEWTLDRDGKGSLRGGSFLTEEPEWLCSEARYFPQEPFAADHNAQLTAGFRCVLQALDEEPRDP